MPPNNNSTQAKKKKKGRKPAHQNAFAFQHNPKSKLTEKILSSPNKGCCQRCHDKIEWRKKYRKYKPLTQPSKCNLCGKRNVMAAYHTICGTCARGEKAWNRMLEMQLQRPVFIEDSTSTEENLESVENEDGESEVVDDPLQDQLTHSEKEPTNDIDDENSNTSTTKSSSSNTKNNTNNSTTNTTQERGVVCAVCTKYPALQDHEDRQENKNKLLSKEVATMEKRLGRALKLREAKALERKVEQRLAKDKDSKKGQRRSDHVVDSDEEH